MIVYRSLFGEVTKQMKTSNAYTTEILPKISVFYNSLLLHIYQILRHAYIIQDEVWVISLIKN